MQNRLDPILEAKRAHVAAQRQRAPEASFDLLANGPTRGFHAALQKARTEGRFGLIAEIKKKSPSKGLIRADFDPATIAKSYEAAGAACLSVLTDMPYFDGHDAYLAAARAAAPSLPALRKDFIVDRYQIAEARHLGADAILLIVAALTDQQLHEFEARALELGLDVLVEVHDQEELQRALQLNTALIGINSRNLKTMQVDPNLVRELSGSVPADRLLIAESGLSTHADLVALQQAGITSFLVGEGLMREADIELATRRLLGHA